MDWRTYLLNIPKRDEYLKCADKIAKSASEDDTHSLTKKLEESEGIIHVSRNVIDNCMQFLYKFFVQGCSFLHKTARYFAFSGLGSHANPVRFAPDKVFRLAPTEKAVPPFRGLLKRGFD